MPERIPWNEYEAALLLRSLVEVLEHKKDKKDAIRRVSYQLRAMAKNQGKIIDDAYRNEAGITVQMSGLEGVLLNGKTPIGRRTTWMTNICDLYHNDPHTFDDIVRRAEKMCETEAKSGAFWKWLAQKNTEEQVIRLQAGYHDLNMYGCNGKPLSKKLDEITDIFELERIQALLEHDVVFRFKYRRMLEPMQEVMAAYGEYRRLKQNQSDDFPENSLLDTETTNDEAEKCVGLKCTSIKHAEAIETVCDDLSEQNSNEGPKTLQNERISAETCCRDIENIVVETENSEIDSVAAIEGMPNTSERIIQKALQASEKKDGIVDFESTDFKKFNNIKPVAFTYFGDRTKEALWQPLYLDVCKKLADDYLSVFLAHDGMTILGTKTEIGTVSGLSKMKQPRSIIQLKNGEWLFVETAFRPEEILERIKVLLNWCMVDFENLEIETETPKQEKTLCSKTYDKQSENNGTQKCFSYTEWARCSGVDAKDINDDIRIFDKMSKILQRQGIAQSNIAEIQKAYELNRIWNSIRKTREWDELTIEEKYIAKDAVARYAQYCLANGVPTSKFNVARITLTGQNSSIEKKKDSIEHQRVEPKIATAENEDALNKQTAVNCQIDMIDFENIQNLAFTRPTSMELLGQDYKVHLWKDVYVLTVKELYSVYAEKFDAITGNPKNGTGLYIDTVMNAYKMRSPKQLTRSSYGKTLFIETNKNATSIAESLKNILDLCECGYNLLSIRYEKTNTDEVELPGKRSAQSVQKWENVAAQAARKNEEGKASYTSVQKTLSTAVTENAVELNATSAGAVVDVQAEKPENGVMPSAKQQHYADLLRDEFPDGFKDGSVIACKKMLIAYQNKYGEEPSESKSEIFEIVRQVGTLRDGRVYPKTHSQLLSEINDEIIDLLNTGATCVYCDAVFERYRIQLAEEQHIYNAEALREPLVSLSRGRYVTKWGMFCLPDRDADISMDVLFCMRKHPAPTTYDELQDELWYIPLDKIKKALMDDPAMVNVGDGTYFYAPNLPVSKEELHLLSSYMESELGYHSYATTKQLMHLIHEKCPTIEINTEGFSTLAVRNSLSYLLRKEFNFRGNIISLATTQPPVDTKQAFCEFCRERETMTTDELQAFADEVDSVIYWDSVFSEMVRVSEHDWVRKDQIRWTPEAIDAKLDEMCEGDYLIIKDICLFLQFPVVDYRWNSFLLESYVNTYSPNYMLLHTSFSVYDCCGAIVKKTSSIHDYHDLAVDVLAKDTNWNDQQSALQVLVDKGLQQRKKLADIAQVVKEARLKREKRQKEST